MIDFLHFLPFYLPHLYGLFHPDTVDELKQEVPASSSVCPVIADNTVRLIRLILRKRSSTMLIYFDINQVTTIVEGFYDEKPV